MKWNANKRTEKVELEEKPKIIISKKLHDKMMTMCEYLPEHEWMGGLIGKEHKDGDITYEDMEIYEQEVTSTTTELTNKGNIQMSNTKSLVGWVHSHCEMEVFLSATDTETAKNTKATLVINNRGEMIAERTFEIMGNRKVRTEAETMIQYDEVKEMEEELNKIKIKEEIENLKTIDDYKDWEERTYGGIYEYS